MGWYHSMNHDGTSDSANAPPCPDGTCPVPNGADPPALSTEPTTTVETEEEEMYLASSPIYHLCQKTLWLQAIEKKEPYFPPTFWSDGRFTRGSCELINLPGTANHYYKHVTGDWLCLQIDPVKLRQLGIPIAAHRAPESTNSEPLQCLKLYGGIPTVIEGVVKDVYVMQRDPAGSFYGMKPDSSVAKMVAVTDHHHHHPHRAKTEKKEDPGQPQANKSSKGEEKREELLAKKTSETTAPKAGRRFWQAKN